MRRELGLLSMLVCISGCRNVTVDPASYVNGLRVLAIKADPPDVPAGGRTTITALTVDTQGSMVSMSWAQCLDAPLTGYTINPDCITKTTASYLVPIGSGSTVMTTMPLVTPTSLGRPDASEGFYLPLIAHVSSANDSLVASYLLRLNLGLPPNQNPILTGMYRVASPDAGAGTALTAIDDSHPLVVHANETVTLRAAFMPGSAERYLIRDGAGARSVTETLSAVWFSTAGTFEGASSGAEVPDVVFHLDQMRNGTPFHLPSSPGPIDIWVVAKDERGGVDYLHRTLQFE